MVMVKNMKKKKHTLKKRYRRLILYIIIASIVITLTVHFVKVYKYHQTDEYKLLEKGYNANTVSNVISSLTKEDINTLLNKDKISNLNDIIKEKYFLERHLFDYIDYSDENKDKSLSDVIAIINVGANKPWYTDSTQTDESKKTAMLVNKFHLLSNNYDAGEIKNFSATYAYGSVRATKEVYDAFIKMANDAKKDNVTLVLSSGYREHDYQEKIYSDIVKKNGQEYADKYAAKPGSSEHETGLALDILSTGEGAFTNNFHKTNAYAWLQEHASEYGFILRYPEGKEYLTGYSPESWHYRYLGPELASKVKSEGITYDEYYAFYLE